MFKGKRQGRYGIFTELPFGFRRFKGIHCEGDGGGSGAASGDGGEGGAASGDGSGTNTEKTFTQKEVDSIVADNRRKVQEKERGEHQKTLAQLEEIKKTANLSTEESASLQKRIDELEGLVMTKEEKASKELEEARTKHEADVKAANEQGDLWKNRYSEATIDRALLDAALKHKAYNPEQVRQVLKVQTSLEEVKDNVGRGTGNFVPMVKMMVPSEDGKTTTEESVVPDKAVELLKSTDKYDNLFLSERAGGTGFRPAAGGTSGGVGNENLSANQKIAVGLKSL